MQTQHWVQDQFASEMPEASRAEAPLAPWQDVGMGCSVWAEKTCRRHQSQKEQRTHRDV